VPAALVYAREKIGGGHDQNIIFAPPDVGWLKSHATAEIQLHTAIIEFHVDLFVVTGAYPQMSQCACQLSG